MQKEIAKAVVDGAVSLLSQQEIAKKIVVGAVLLQCLNRKNNTCVGLGCSTASILLSQKKMQRAIVAVSLGSAGYYLYEQYQVYKKEKQEHAEKEKHINQKQEQLKKKEQQLQKKANQKQQQLKKKEQQLQKQQQMIQIRSIASSSTSYDIRRQEQSDYLCQITLQMMVEPTDTPCGHIFERTEIEKKLLIEQKCPVLTCGKQLKIDQLKSNEIIKRQIKRFKEKQAKTQAKNKLRQMNRNN